MVAIAGGGAFETPGLGGAAALGLDLALALHPTPAVCGFPRRTAARAIADIEGERGFYAGAVGWTAANGDGHWRVSIRCAELDGARLRAYAGGGVVGVEALADDLRRWRDGQPILARADSATYRTRRFIGRHRTAVALGVLAEARA